MIEKIIEMYINTLPVILAGICNMIIVKQKWFKSKAKPIDKGYRLSDGNRVLGDNKTSLGFITMILSSIVTHIVWGEILEVLNIHSNLYGKNLIYNALIGACMGIAYMICELPNSFLKRRKGISSGKKGHGLKGILFFVLDYVDSIFGVAFVIHIFSDIVLYEYINYIILGGLTHLIVNIVLYLLKIKKEI